MIVAVGARWSYEEAYDNVADGSWYMGSHNEEATLAWGESYVMMSLASMYRATGHPMYLDRLAEHVDAVLEQRDDVRGVTDYRGVSGACWRNVSYQPEPYCYVVHTGMLIYPMAEFAAFVEASNLGDEAAYDGETFGEKATRYLMEAEASVAEHEDQWNAAGYYVFRPDADFLTYPGVDLPLNQSNAMGRALVILATLTGDADHQAKATALAQRMRDQVTVGGDGAYLWNYWGGALSGDGEDISHAAINVDFAALAAEHDFVWTEADVLGMARTFVQRVYVDDGTVTDFMGGGGAVNGSGYRPQVGRWLRVARTHTAVYTAVRDLFRQDYAADSLGSGSVLLGWALLAEHEPLHCAPFFYSVDWDDQGDVREATAYGANILTVPYALDTGCIVPTQVDVPRATEVQQWDGAAYHRVASWRPTGGMADRFVPFEPQWPFVYSDNGVLFQFADTFVEGDGIVVAEHPGFVDPVITSTPPAELDEGASLDYTLTGDFEGPHWWRLVEGPGAARLDPDTGVLSWTPDAAGNAAFTVRLEVDHGAVEQEFTISVVGEPGGESSSSGTGGEGEEAGEAGDGEGEDGTAGEDGGSAPTAGDAGGSGETGDTTSPQRGDEGDGCGCRTRGSGSPAWLMFGLLGLAVRPRRWT